MQKLKKVLSFPLIFIAFIIFYVYKFLLSPFLPNVCRYYPTCSSYAIQSIKSYGIIKGSYFAVRRLLRCRGKYKGGCDYIPDNVKNEFKWLI